MTADASSRKASQSSVSRKISKGVIERKRRARINRSLAELKFMILSETSDKTLHSKLDKAEILERTLVHIQTLQKEQSRSRSHSSPTGVDQNAAYSSGFFSCMTEVDRFLCGQKVNESARLQITNHLTLASKGVLASRLQQQQEVCQKLPSLRTFGCSTSPAPCYGIVPGSPSPSTFSVTSSNSQNDSRLSPFSTASSDAVWRPW